MLVRFFLMKRNLDCKIASFFQCMMNSEPDVNYKQVTLRELYSEILSVKAKFFYVYDCIN